MSGGAGDDAGRAELPGHFAAIYGRPADFLAVAPGRVNVIGEHVDYSGGLAMPAAIDRRMLLAFAPRDDARIVVADRALGDRVNLEIGAPLPPGAPRWGNYVAGVAAVLQRQAGPLRGFDAVLTSSIPRGGGLSSSAALEAVIGLALATRNELALGVEAMARVCQQAEQEFAGVPCGLMDQMAVLGCRAGELLLLDCENNRTSGVPFRHDGWSLLIVNSGVAHENAASEYGARRRACEAAAARLGVRSLRHLALDALPAILAHSSLTTEMKRLVRHVVTENARTLEVAEALRGGNYARAGAAMNAGHASLRDDYRVSCVELDHIVATAQALEGVAGCRMTGGGFGGSAVTLVRTERAENCAAQIDASFRQRYGTGLDIFVTRAAGGARVMVVK